MCKVELNTDKVRDHCHITGKSRGVSHNKCTVNFRLLKKLPIIIHKLQAYYGHLMFKELNNFDVTIDVIVKTIEKYMSIIVREILLLLTFYNLLRLQLILSYQI